MEAQLVAIEKELVENSGAAHLYELRGKVLTSLLKFSNHPAESASFAERAFADFHTFELLQKEPALQARGELHELIWRTDGGTDSQTLSGDAFRNSPHFEGAVAAYLETIRRQTEAEGNLDNESLKNLCAKVAQLYTDRAQTLASVLAEKTLSDLQLIWSDFDQAAEHRKRSIDALTVIDVAEIYVKKGETAYALGEYSIALESCQAAEDYIDLNWERQCKYIGEYNCDYWKKGFVDRVSRVRAQVDRKQTESQNRER